MAVTGNGYQPRKYNYKQLQNPAPAGQRVSTGAEQLRGVSDQTRAQQAKYQNGYNPSENVTAARAQMQQVLGAKPAGFQSKYGAALDDVLQKIQNPDQFQYSFNNDEMFKYYADLYTQKGRQASADAMGQAAGLTGGYGNSYAQAVGNQAYEQYLLSLYDRGMDLQDRAYQRYRDQQGDNYSRLQALQSADATDYGRYRDDVGDWERERDYYTGRENTEYGRDYDAFVRDRDYWAQQAQAENADYWNAMQFNEQMRQADAARQLQYDQLNTENQYRYDTLEEEQAQFGANFGENQRQYDTTMAENQRQFDEKQAEEIRQFNETSRYDWAKLEQDQAQFDANLTEEQRQYNRDLAYKYVQAILAMNQIPSNDLLVAAGLSLEDAQKMIQQVIAGGGGGIESSGGGGGGGGKRSGNNNTATAASGKKTSLNGMTFEEVNLIDNADKVAQKVSGNPSITYAQLAPLTAAEIAAEQAKKADTKAKQALNSPTAMASIQKEVMRKKLGLK